jgi:predicted nucleotidyltransferase component of viral defense system
VNRLYLDSARLLTRVAPLVLVDDTFALKGGTAINLFVRDMPRLSVDLDLVFPDHTLPREQALRRINEAIRRSAARLKKQGFLTHAPASADAGETKLLVRQGAIEVKIEVNFVMRGTVNPVRMVPLTQNARDTLQADLEIPVVSLEDVYGGKLVAAMDRQHPRDLFDVSMPIEFSPKAPLENSPLCLDQSRPKPRGGTIAARSSRSRSTMT